MSKVGKKLYTKLGNTWTCMLYLKCMAEALETRFAKYCISFLALQNLNHYLHANQQRTSIDSLISYLLLDWTKATSLKYKFLKNCMPQNKFISLKCLRSGQSWISVINHFVNQVKHGLETHNFWSKHKLLFENCIWIKQVIQTVWVNFQYSWSVHLYIDMIFGDISDSFSLIYAGPTVDIGLQNLLH